MPLRLRDIAAGAGIYAGINKGRDTERARQRKRVLEQREDIEWKRKNELGELEHGDKVDVLRGERGAREAARSAAAPAPAGEEQPEQVGGPDFEQAPDTSGMERMPETGPRQEPRRLGLAQPGDSSRGLTPMGGAAPPAAAPAAPAEKPKALWVRTAEAQRDYWMKQGRPERASEVMKKAYSNAFAEDEARYKYELEPRERDIRLLNLDEREIAANEKASALRRTSIETQITAAGKLWGLVKMGATSEAIYRFNGSTSLQPGVKAASIKVLPATDQNGQEVEVMAMFDEKGEVVKDKSGKELIYPTAMLERALKLATTSTLSLNKGQSMYQLHTDPVTGAITSKPVITAQDQTEGRADEKAWAEVLNKHRDDARAYLRDTLGLTPNALGQIMKPDNQPIFERALPKVTAKLNEARATGKKMTQLDGISIAKEALAESRDELAKDRKKKPTGKSDGPNWRDALK